MTTLAHISDVHFGREDPDLVDGLLHALTLARPDAIVISGDLTQRARKSQFRCARAFLRALPPVPHLIVPGNHDVSATNLIDRLARPLKRYRRFISDDLTPFLDLPTVAIAGINTVRLLSTKDGRINRNQVAIAREQLGRAAPEAFRVIVTHHPMDLPIEDLKHPLVVRSAPAIAAFSASRVDLFLSGHLHTGQTVVTSSRYGQAASTPHFSAVVAHAGTAVSTRTRGEPNAWNLIHLNHNPESPEISVDQITWDLKKKKFLPTHTTSFTRGPNGWSLTRSESVRQDT